MFPFFFENTFIRRHYRAYIISAVTRKGCGNYTLMFAALFVKNDGITVAQSAIASFRKKSVTETCVARAALRTKGSASAAA